MASSVACILGNAADGEAFSGQAHRLGMGSSATFVNTGSTPAVARSGIVPSGGTPLDVAPLGTPAMKVNVKAGTCVVQSTSATGGCFTVTLTTATDLDIGTSNPTNPRIDLVVAKVFADGTSATNCTVEVIAGTAAASPARPSISSPPANTHYFPLAQVRVEANATTIVAGKVTKATAVDGVWTAAAGGLVPVANLTEAGALPLYTPFYSIADRSSGKKLPGGASLDGHQWRYIDAFGAVTNASGDVTVPFGLWLAGVWTAAPFPNGCFGAAAFDSSSFVTVDAPLWFKQPRNAYGLNSANATFRVYQTGGKYVSAGLDISGIAWGW
jgi:hypothetical protein